MELTEWQNGLEGNSTGSQVVYPAGVRLFEQGKMPDGVYIVYSGIVKLVFSDRNGKEVIVGLRAKGWALGTAAVILCRPHVTTGVTLTSCRLARMSARDMHDRLDKDACFSRYLHEVHAREVHEHLRRSVQITLSPADERLCFLIRDIANSVNGDSGKSGGRVPIPLRQWELAELLGVSPEHLNRMLRRLETAGVVRRRKGRVLLVSQLTSTSPH